MNTEYLLFFQALPLNQEAKVMSSMILHPWGFGNFLDASSVPFQNSTLCYLGMRFKYFFKGEKTESKYKIPNSSHPSWRWEWSGTKEPPLYLKLSNFLRVLLKMWREKWRNRGREMWTSKSVTFHFSDHLGTTDNSLHPAALAPSLWVGSRRPSQILRGWGWTTVSQAPLGWVQLEALADHMPWQRWGVKSPQCLPKWAQGLQRRRVLHFTAWEWQPYLEERTSRSLILKGEEAEAKSSGSEVRMGVWASPTKRERHQPQDRGDD